jgi:hypothetical protein
MDKEKEVAIILRELLFGKIDTTKARERILLLFNVSGNSALGVALPSDKEIEEYLDDQAFDNTEKRLGAEKIIKWLKNKIEKQNKRGNDC